MFDILEKSLEFGRSLGPEYIELRAEDILLTTIQFDDGQVKNLNQRIEKGVAIRVLNKGAWGFVATSDFENLSQYIERAVALAKSAATSRREPIKLAETKAVTDTVKLSVKESPVDLSNEEKVEWLSEVYTQIKDYDERIGAVSLKLRDGWGKKYLVTSAGHKIEFDIGFVHHYAWVTGKEGATITAARDEVGTTSEGWEFLKEMQGAEGIGKRVANRVKLQLEAVAAKGGTFPTILAPHVIGVVAHEALGHLSEADLTVQSSFGGKLGQKVANDFVNMTDDGTLPGGFGSSKYDDEGTPTSRVEIIKDGILTELLTNREYAARLGLRPTGNARAQDYRYMPIIRMRNTFFEKGDWADDELFEGIKFGYLCVDFRGGQAELNASFQVGVQEAYEIVNGEIGRPVKDLSISGIATDTLFKIEGIGKDTFEFEQGRCGKGQEAFISAGGPMIRVSEGGITFGGKK